MAVLNTLHFFRLDDSICCQTDCPNDALGSVFVDSLRQFCLHDWHCFLQMAQPKVQSRSVALFGFDGNNRAFYSDLQEFWGLNTEGVYINGSINWNEYIFYLKTVKNG